MRFSKIFRFTLGSRILAVKINAWNQELHTHYGITNETSDGMYIPFWDFVEDIPLYWIFNSLRVVQKENNLNDIYVLQTYPKQSYRAFGFDALTFAEYIKILSSTRYIDWSYLKHSVMRNRAVLRISEKDGTTNKLIKVLDSYTIIPTSKHHQAFFSAMYPDKIPKPDLNEKIQVRLSKYESFR